MKNTWCFAVMAGADAGEPRPHLHCRRCGERMVTILPLRLETYTEALKGFVKAHAHCKERKAVRA